MILGIELQHHQQVMMRHVIYYQAKDPNPYSGGPELFVYVEKPRLGLMNLQCERGRDWFIRRIMESHSFDPVPMRLPYYWLGEEEEVTMQAKRYNYLQLLGIEFIIRPNLLTSTLQSMRNRRDKWRMPFIECIVFNQLILRHLFRMGRQKLIDSLLSVVLDISVAQKTELQLFSGELIPNMSNGGDMIKGPFPTHLKPWITTMKYWKTEHFVFAAHNGISALFADLWLRRRHGKHMRSICRTLDVLLYSNHASIHNILKFSV